MDLSLNEYLKKESKLKKIDSFTIFGGIPIWRIVRSKMRGELLNERDKTVGAKISMQLFVNVLTSFIQLTKIVVRRKHIDNIIFPHPRLFKIGDIFIERLSDPIIEYSNIKKSYILFERWQNGIHQKPRMHSDKCIYWDFIPFFALTFSRLFDGVVTKKYTNHIKGLVSDLSKEFDVTDEMIKDIRRELSCFIISYKLSSPILKACSPKRVFLAPRTTFNYVIALGKKKNFKSYELQHGITLGQTKLYSGEYNDAIDPDYFLSFGKGNVSNLFGIPLEKIKNIGYAYGCYIKDLQKGDNDQENRILVISEPQISEILLDTIGVLAKLHGDWEFDFRCHPQESLNKKQKEFIKSQPNIHEVDTIGESFSVINKYPIIIGENSSVIFEALFLRKQVGRLNFNGLHVDTDSAIQGGVIINSIEEFDSFIKSQPSEYNDTLSLYSEFNPDTVNNLE